MSLRHDLPMVTIMIPTYNQSEFLGDAIRSALAQTYPNLEVIVGDDASNDNTGALAATFSDPRLRYVRNGTNLGRRGNYRSLLYQHARGDYVVNLDGDDYYTDPDFIAEAVKLATGAPEVAMVVARATTKTSAVEQLSGIPDRPDAAGLEVLQALPDPRYMLMHMAVLYARRPALELDFYRSGAMSSDWESLYRLALRGRVRYLDRNVGVWRVHGANETAGNDPDALLGNLGIWPVVYREAVAFGMSPAVAALKAARNVAFFAQAGFRGVSRRGNAALVGFVLSVVRRYPLAAVLLVLSPRYAMRLVLALAGGYRWKVSR